MNRKTAEKIGAETLLLQSRFAGDSRGTIARRMSELGERIESSITASREFRRHRVRNVLLQVGGDRMLAAEILGTDMETLLRLMAE
jgi:hypothetical protein